jgi:hypothetical protein
LHKGPKQLQQLTLSVSHPDAVPVADGPLSEQQSVTPTSATQDTELLLEVLDLVF